MLTGLAGGPIFLERTDLLVDKVFEIWFALPGSVEEIGAPYVIAMIIARHAAH